MVVAVAARNLEGAQKFADKFAIPKAYAGRLGLVAGLVACAKL